MAKIMQHKSCDIMMYLDKLANWCMISAINSIHWWLGHWYLRDGRQTAGYVTMTLYVGLAFTFTAQSSSTGYTTKHSVVATVDGSEIQRSPAQLAVEIPLPVQSGFFYSPGGLRFLDHQQYHWKLKHDAGFLLTWPIFSQHSHVEKAKMAFKKCAFHSHVPKDACTPGASNGCLRKQIYSRMRGLRPTPGG